MLALRYLIPNGSWQYHLHSGLQPLSLWSDLFYPHVILSTSSFSNNNVTIPASFSLRLCPRLGNWSEDRRSAMAAHLSLSPACTMSPCGGGTASLRGLTSPLAHQSPKFPSLLGKSPSDLAPRCFQVLRVHLVNKTQTLGLKTLSF